jgi:tetratricopeptide (TPR) repeat protein
MRVATGFDIMPRFARRLAILSLAAAVTAAAGQDPWIKITSANFQLYTTAGEFNGRDLVRHFEQVRGFFVQEFGDHLTDAKPTCIVAFRNGKEYEPYRPSEAASAFFQPNIAHDFIVMSSASVEQYPVAVHEFTHLMVHQGGRNYPPWFNEGLAELFSNLQPMGNKIAVGLGIRGRQWSLQNDKWIPLEGLLGVDRSSPYYNEKSKAGIFYAESWELVRMLFLDPRYRPQLGALDEALKKPVTPAVLEAIYRKSIGAIEADLHGYARGGEVNLELHDIRLSKAAETPVVETGAAMGARLALAEVLSGNRGKLEAVGAELEALAKEYPNRWEVEQGLGQFAWRQRKLDDAARHYARAVELGGQDARLFLDYGRVLDSSNRLGDAIDNLSKASQLDPADDEIRFALAGAYLRHGNFGVALAELRAIKKVQPAQAYRYYYDLALGEWRTGETAGAKAHSAQARSFAHGSGELSTLDSLDREIEPPAGAAVSGGPAPVSSGSSEPPRQIHQLALIETRAPQDAPAQVLPSAAGTFEHLECGKPARLHVRVDGKVLIFAITDPDSVIMRSGNGAAVELQCGAQKPPRAVHIEYQALPGQPDVAGAVRSLEFE